VVNVTNSQLSLLDRQLARWCWDMCTKTSWNQNYIVVIFVKVYTFPIGVQSTAICVSVGMSVCEHISKFQKPNVQNFTKFQIHVACDRGTNTVNSCRIMQRYITVLIGIASLQSIDGDVTNRNFND